MRTQLVILIAVVLMLLISCAGWSSSDGDNPAATQGPALTLPLSLHGTAAGMRWWYERPTGLGALINVPYNMTGCGSCHAKGCEDCHSAGGSGPVDQPAACIVCHGRQDSEFKQNISDVHFTAGMVCSDCHMNDLHGDGTTPSSMFEDGAIDASCEGCHINGSAPAPPDSISHTQHGDKLRCDACHVSTVTTCYNCHFNSLLDDHVKKPYKPFKNFVILANDAEGKVTTASYQSVVKDGKTFVAFGPYHGHSVTAQGRSCGNCHNSDRMQELKDTGKIIMTSWDATVDPITTKPVGIVHTTGVVPFAPDSFEFQFVDFDKATGVWSPLKTVADGLQFEYCTPLTDEQLEALGAK